LLEEIGRGGQGVVYRARQKSQPTVVKQIGVGDGYRDALRRFWPKLKPPPGLNHPSIVPIHEIGERDGYRYSA
jgi:serine/threonine-protein kinase